MHIESGGSQPIVCNGAEIIDHSNSKEWFFGKSSI